MQCEPGQACIADGKGLFSSCSTTQTMLPAQNRACLGRSFHRLQATSYNARKEPTTFFLVIALQGRSQDECTMQRSACTAMGRTQENSKAIQ